MDRAEIRRLQDRAIKAIELLFPNAVDLDNQRVCTGGPTVAEARMCIFPQFHWLWLDWIEQAQGEGHDV